MAKKDDGSKDKKPKPKKIIIANDSSGKPIFRVEESVLNKEHGETLYRIYGSETNGEIIDSEIFRRIILKAGKPVDEVVNPQKIKKQGKKFVGYYLASSTLSTKNLETLKVFSDVLSGRFKEIGVEVIFVKGKEGEVLYARKDEPGRIYTLEGKIAYQGNSITQKDATDNDPKTFRTDEEFYRHRFKSFDVKPTVTYRSKSSSDGEPVDPNKALEGAREDWKNHKRGDDSDVMSGKKPGQETKPKSESVEEVFPEIEKMLKTALQGGESYREKVIIRTAERIVDAYAEAVRKGEMENAEKYRAKLYNFADQFNNRFGMTKPNLDKWLEEYSKPSKK